MFFLPFVLAASLTRASALVVPEHAHATNARLPTNWYQPRDHSVHALFRRAPTDGLTYAAVGSDAWSSPFPAAAPDTSKLPKEWVDALNAAVAAGKIPDIPVSHNANGANPTYPTGFDPNGKTVCSATYKCRIPGDIWDAPSGYFGASFDDGPLSPTTDLVEFLQENNQTATHFMIGTNIIQNPDEFLTAFNASHDIAVHTWTHPYMTTLSNLQVVGELGWTMELIHNSTGGRVPKFWRPPYGDSDTRVTAIANEVFGLTTIIWNQDTEDWSLTSGGTTPDKVHASLTKWLSGPKSPGLIILEHELSTQSVQAFMDAFPLIKSNGWNIESLAQLVGNGTSYQNSDSSVSAVAPADILDGSSPPPVNSTQALAPTSTSTASSTASASKTSGDQSNVQQSSTSNSAVLVGGGLSWATSTLVGILLAVSVFV